MKVIDIPVLPMDTPLEEAYAAMRKMKRSGVAARGRDGQYWLFKGRVGRHLAGRAVNAFWRTSRSGRESTGFDRTS